MEFTWQGILLDASAIIIFILLTLIPWFIAKKRGDPHSASVLIIALFSGWTLIGWVLALSFSVRGRNWEKPEPKESLKLCLIKRLRGMVEDKINEKKETQTKENQGE